ncbi:MAG: FTR1 family protein [Deltaproteobacteria bacterium]|nr:FTR1 family protein [Deltaproteobacteria bacterium]
MLALVAGLAVVSLAAPARAEEVSADVRSQAQQLVTLVDYVAADYPRAVDHGKITTQSEYAEQRGLLADALEIAKLLPSKEVGFDAAPALVKLDAQAAQIADGDVLATGLHALRTELVARYGIATAPTALPQRSHGAALYEQACAACHGLDGKALTDTARELHPTPARFDEAERMDKLSPFRAFNAVTYGVKGTSMPSFDVLSESDRWDLATWIFTLRSGPADAARARVTLIAAGLTVGPPQLATLTDGDILGRLTNAHIPPDDATNALAFLRQTGAYVPPPSGDLDAVRSAFSRASMSYVQGDRAGARNLLLTAYLDGYEPREPALRARDADRVSEVEDAFVQLRGAMEAGDVPDVVRSREARLDALLEAQGQTNTKGAAQVAFWGSLIIVLREGLEAALLVATLLAVLKRSGRQSQARAVHTGWMLALGTGVVTWFVSGHLIAASGANRETVEGVVQLLTAAFLFYASHWLLARAHAQRWLGFLNKQAPGAGSAAAVMGLAFLAVFREMFEVVVFYRGLLIETGGQTLMLWLGATAGAAALAVAVLGFMRVGKKLPLRPFLLTCGLLLIGLSVVMVGHGVRALQEAGWLRLTPLAFSSVSAVGLYNSVEGLVAQAVLLVAVAVSALWSRLSGEGGKPVGPASPAAPAR